MKVLRAAVEAMEAGVPAALVTVVGVDGSAPRSAGTRMLVHADGSIVGTVGGGTFEHRLVAEAVAAIADRRPRRFSVNLTRDLGMCCGGAMDALVEPLDSREHLVIHGGGHVGAATAAIGAALDFDVTVVDERDEMLEPGRFPPSVRLVEADPRRVLHDLPYGDRAYHLVVTHSHQLDQDLIELLLPRPLAWLGLIGSRTKAAKFFIRLRAAGVDPALFDRVSTPVGLDIGAETPAEIAVAIAAELVAVRRRVDRPHLPLKDVPATRMGTGPKR